MYIFIFYFRAFPEAVEFFKKQISLLGIQKCVDKYLPRLIPGLYIAAFHALIQVGYGVEYELPTVLAEGLAYTCCKYRTAGELIDRLSQIKSHDTYLSLLSIFSELKEMNIVLPKKSKFDFDFEDLLVKHEEELKSLLMKWEQCAEESQQTECLNKLTKMAILVFFGSYQNNSLDFFFLHVLTGVHAVRVLLPRVPVPERSRILRIFLVAFLGTYCHQGQPEFNEEVIYKYGGPSKAIDWKRILKQTLEFPEGHVIKVIHSLLTIKESVQDSHISHKLVDHSAYMIVNVIKNTSDYSF